MTTKNQPLSDLEIASQAVMKPIIDIAKAAGIPEDALEQYGRYKAKIDPLKITAHGEDAKVVLVTAISPTPAGEGKSTVTVGLADALHQLKKNVVVALREPSLGPVMGVKGVVTEAGFGSDLGAEKFMNIKARKAGLNQVR
ncbi:Formate--tetrahydrofolate ligase [Lysinibacillus sphaericus]